MGADLFKEVHVGSEILSANTGSSWFDFTDTPDSSYPWPSAATALEVVSSSAGDSAGGVGIRSVWATLIDEQWQSQRVQVALNGTTPVAIPGGPYIRANLIVAQDAGANEDAEGDIDVRVAGAGAVLRRIPAGATRTGSLVFSNPATSRYRLTNYHVSIGDAKNNDEFRIRIQARSMANPAWVTLSGSPLLSQNFVEYTDTWYDGLMADPASDIRVQYQAPGANVPMRCVMEVIE